MEIRRDSHGRIASSSTVRPASLPPCCYDGRCAGGELRHVPRMSPGSQFTQTSASQAAATRTPPLPDTRFRNLPRWATTLMSLLRHSCLDTSMRGSLGSRTLGGYVWTRLCRKSLAVWPLIYCFRIACLNMSFDLLVEYLGSYLVNCDYNPPLLPPLISAEVIPRRARATGTEGAGTPSNAPVQLSSRRRTMRTLGTSCGEAHSYSDKHSGLGAGQRRGEKTATEHDRRESRRGG